MPIDAEKGGADTGDPAVVPLVEHGVNVVAAEDLGIVAEELQHWYQRRAIFAVAAALAVASALTLAALVLPGKQGGSAAIGTVRDTSALMQDFGVRSGNDFPAWDSSKPKSANIRDAFEHLVDASGAKYFLDDTDMAVYKDRFEKGMEPLVKDVEEPSAQQWQRWLEGALQDVKPEMLHAVKQAIGATNQSFAVKAQPWMQSFQQQACQDYHQHCAAWARAGYCRTNAYTRTNCRASCRFCQVIPGPYVKGSVGNTCPRGYSHILDQNTCRSAIAALRERTGSFDRNRNDRPPGCYFVPHAVWFNHMFNPTQPWRGGQPVCKRQDNERKPDSKPDPNTDRFAKFRGGFEPLDSEFVIDGLPDAGVKLPDGVTNRACVQNGGRITTIDDSGPIGCNRRCVKERREGSGCWAIQHEVPSASSQRRRREGTCKIFTRPVTQTVPRQGATCSRLGLGGEVPQVSAAACSGPPKSDPIRANTPHALMTTNCPNPVLKTQCMTRRQYDDIVVHVKRALNRIDDTCDMDSCPQADWAGCVLRMAGHDFMDFDPAEGDGRSGSNACTQMDHTDNRGLKACLSDSEHGESLKHIYEGFCEHVSLADFLVIAAEAVMVVSREHVIFEDDPDAPQINFRSKFRYGRTTATSCTGAANRLPDPEDSCDAVSETFLKHMGMTKREAAALMGVHTLGRARPQNSGYDGWWSDPVNSKKFNNNYFASMVKKGWRPMRAVCGNGAKNQWYMSGPGGVHQGGALEMMLDTDICLAFSNANPGEVNVTEQPGDPIKASRDSCCAWLITHPITKKPLGTFNEICGLHDIHDCGSIRTNNGFGLAGQHIFEFAENEHSWLDTFLHAWNQATENGYDSLKLLKNSCP